MKDVFSQDSYSFSKTGVEFKTNDEKLQRVFDRCEELCRENLKTLGDYDVLIEGAKYRGVWLETQPIGGEMYAKRSIRTALGNMLIFMRYQRRDGRYPGMISYIDKWKGLCGHYDWMQGCFLPHAALKMYYYINKDKDYLKLLYDSLKDFDEYLWKYRDSDGDGCLEAWCVWDTGEDNCTKHMLNGLTMPENGGWSKSTAPEEYGNMPYESAEYMSYSYACRIVLAKASEILENGQSEYWNERAKEVQKKFCEYLWDKEKGACYDRDRNNEMMYILSQQNIKCMYNEIFTQEMADEFIKRHLLNPEEFWTPYPLPSIAANDKFFYVNEKYSNCTEEIKKYLKDSAPGIDDNSWSGPIAGLTYQRSIKALLNYKHHAETALIGKRLLKLTRETQVFKQQFNPYTGEYCLEAADGYGPMVLSNLEYISLLYGVNVDCDGIWWSGADGEYDFEYSQNMFGNKYTLTCTDGKMFAYANGKLLFSFTEGVRIKTDLEGKITEIYGISPNPANLTLLYENTVFEAEIIPNGEYHICNDKVSYANSVPFDYMTKEEI